MNEDCTTQEYRQTFRLFLIFVWHDFLTHKTQSYCLVFQLCAKYRKKNKPERHTVHTLGDYYDMVRKKGLRDTLFDRRAPLLSNDVLLTLSLSYFINYCQYHQNTLLNTKGQDIMYSNETLNSQFTYTADIYIG